MLNTELLNIFFFEKKMQIASFVGFKRSKRANCVYFAFTHFKKKGNRDERQPNRISFINYFANLKAMKVQS